MKDSGDILSLLGIPSDKVAFIDGFHVDKTNDKIIISLIDDRPNCPYCNSDKIVIHDYYKVVINNSILQKRLLTVEIDMRRYKCKNCGKTFKESFSFYKPKESISIVQKLSIKESLKECVSYSLIARQYGVSTNTVINIFDSIPRQPKLLLSEVLCVDEFHFSNRNNPKLKYPFVMSDPFKGKIIDIVESRKWEYLREYFNKIGVIERSRVKYFISDMNEVYRTLKKVYFKDAVHIIDHFHVMKLFNNAIQKIRTKIMKENKEEENTKEYRFLKKYWKMFVCNKDKLKTYKKINKNTGVTLDWEILVNETLKKYPKLFDAYWTREEFNKKVVKLKSWFQTKQIMDFFLNQLINSETEELRVIGNTFSNWYEELINSYSKTSYGFFLSNAIAEANNNNIQTLVDACYGLGNFERTRNRILYINREKNQKPD